MTSELDSQLLLGLLELLELVADAARLRAERDVSCMHIGKTEGDGGRSPTCGQSASIDLAFFSHSPLLAQSAHASSLSVHTVEHTPHVRGQSRITAPGFCEHSDSPQMAHCVVFLSSQTAAWQTSHEAGHVFSVNPGCA